MRVRLASGSIGSIRMPTRRTRRTESMPHRPRATLTLLFATICLIGPAAFADTASATPKAYGELTRFGEAGVGSGKLTTPVEEPFDEQLTGTRAIGVDPRDNSVYVVDEPKPAFQQHRNQAVIIVEPEPGEVTEEYCPKGYTAIEDEETETIKECIQQFGPVTRHLRLQKFKANGSGEYEAVASAEFEEQLPDFEVEPFEELQKRQEEIEKHEPHTEVLARGEPTIEGIAVDPSRERVYLLAVDERRKAPDVGNGAGRHTLEASTLYAFKTKASGTTLEGAGSEGPHNEVLTGRTAIGAESATAGKALLEPAGITLAPKTGDVIVLAHVDEHGEALDKIANEHDHYVLQRIAPSGALEARYVDETNVLKQGKPNSPIAVENAAKEEHVYLNNGVVAGGALEQIPDEFTSTTPPSPFKAFSPDNGVVKVQLSSSTGGLLSVSPDGKTIFATAFVGKEQKGGFAQPLSGVVELSAETGAEIGWTGGQEKGGGRFKCVVEPYFVEYSTPRPQVAAGEGGKLFVLAPEWLLREEVAIMKKIPGPYEPAVIEFGGEASAVNDCATASDGGIVAEVGGEPLKEELTPVSPNKLVTLSSRVNQADALSVEWTYLNETNHQETHEVVSSDELQSTKIVRQFGEGGSFEVTEKVHTDDLATPEVSASRKVVVLGPTITTQPNSVSVKTTENAKFKAGATGSEKVQWEVKKSASGAWAPDTSSEDEGATTDELTVKKATVIESGYEYRAVFTNSEGYKGITKAATLTVGTGEPVIFEQPTSVTVLAGETAAFKAEASGSPAPTVQWEVSKNGGRTWEEDTGHTEDELKVTGTTTAENGWEYRAKFSNGVGSPATSNAATLTVEANPHVTEQPANVGRLVGENATFKAEAVGTPPVTVQWEVKEGAGSWKPDSSDEGTTTDTLTVRSVKTSQGGNEYRAKFSSGGGGEATSNPASLTVEEAPKVTGQPANATKLAGEAATFTATASGIPAPTVEWEVKEGALAPWVFDVSDEGIATDTLTVKHVAAFQSGFEYRAKFTSNGRTATSNPATLTVHEAPSVTLQPNSVAVTAGETATFKAEASGSPAPTVQWEFSENGSTWSNVAGPSSTEAELKLSATTTSESGWKYRAKFSNGAGSPATSSIATLTVEALPTITKQPAGTTVLAGETATFTASATGASKEQWEVSANGGASWTNDTADAGNTTTELKVAAATTVENGYEYRVRFSNNAGGSTPSAAATLTVHSAPSVTLQPKPVTVTAGETAVFTAAASGS